MAGTSEIEALKTICSEIDESQIKVILSTQCIKAQTYLVNKLKKKTEQNKERCSFIFTANLTLQSEIDQAQQKITSLLIAQDTIKKGNVELKKEWLLAKERTLEVIERVNIGEKKYEDLWLESKARYESLPFVQKLLKANDEVLNIKQQINELENEAKLIYEEIKIKTETCREVDRKRIVEFAGFVVIEMPKYVNLVKERFAAINAIVEELNSLDPKTVDDVSSKDHNDVSKPDNDCKLMPKLQLNYLDFENLNANLDKIRGDDPFTKTPEKTYTVHSILVIDPSKLNKKKSPNTEEHISSFFYNPIAKYESNKSQNYAKKKLINILEDIKINQNEAQKIIDDVNPEVLQPVHSISHDDHQNIDKNIGILNTKDNDDLEEIDLTASVTGKIIMPPMQFLNMTSESQEDISQKVSQKEQSAEVLNQASTSKEKNYQEEPCEKKVKFDLSNKVETKAIHEAGKPEHEKEIDANETINSQLNVSDADDGFSQIKDMIMKKHNLDLSPHFEYAKNIMTPLNLQKPKDAVVTSKFFPQDHNNTEVEPEVVENNAVEEDQDMTAKEEVAATPKKIDEPYNLPTQGLSISKNQTVPELTEAEKPITGSLYGQSTQVTCDNWDESTNATVFGDGDEFPSCLDASLLLSPKAADLSMPNLESQEVLSQDVPNFLTGLRKTGLSFFGRLSSESKPDSSGQNQNQGASGFSFNFGEEKKSRGGLFSMFQ